MVRNKFRWFGFGLTVCALFFVTSCADTDTNGIDDGRVPVQFTSQIKRHVAASRAVDTSWSANDHVGIYMVEDKGSLPAGAVFSQYQVLGSGGEMATFVPTATDQTLYYPTNGSKVNFVAFSPYVEPSNNAVSYSTFSDQSERTKMEAVDFLYHKGTTAYSQTDASITLTFGHKLSKLVIEAVTTDDATAIDLTDLDIQITGMPDGVTASLTDGAVTASSTLTNITPYVTDVTDKRTATAILVPHNGTSGRTIELSIPDVGVFTHTFADGYNFVSGKEYVLTFTVNRKGATLSGAEINDWVDDSWTDTGSYYLNMKSDKNMSLPTSGGTFNIAFETNYPVGVALKYSTSATDANAGKPEWITNVQTSMTETAGVVTCNSSFEVDASVPLRTGYAHVTAGKFATVITITQGYPVAISANCVVLQTGGDLILIPVTIANDAATYSGVSAGRDDGYTAPFATSGVISFDTKVLWVDAPSFATGSRVASVATDIIAEVDVVQSDLVNSYLLVKPGTKEGNAVVCITKPGTNNIIWSWHIWVVNPADRAKMWIDGSSENTITSKPPATANGYAFLPINLGAFNSAGDATPWNASIGWSGHPFVGLFYQWGRKDPLTNRVTPTWIGDGLSTSGLPYINGVTEFVTDDTANYTGMKSIKYPHYFNWTSNENTGWQGTIHLTGVTNNSWGFASSVYGNKSPFDPCPAGWRVPPSYDSSGADWSGNAWKGINENKGSWEVINGINNWTLPTYGGNYPATGNRYGNAIFGSGGTFGYHWSAGPSGGSQNFAYRMYFNSFGFDDQNKDNSRYVSYQVRCVTSNN